MSEKNKSLAPYGDTLHQWLVRLNAEFPGVNPEALLMKMWEEENIPRLNNSGGWTAIEAIVQGHPSETGERVPIADRDRQIVAATIQWLATNYGRCFYEEFQKRLKEEYMKKTKRKNETGS